jgi:hypothetical protein
MLTPDADALYRKYYPLITKTVRVYSVTYRIHEDDLLSGAGMLFLKCLPRYDPTRPFSPWFKRRLVLGLATLVRKEIKRRTRFVAGDVEPDEVMDHRTLTADEPFVVPDPDGRRLVRETLDLEEAWHLKNPYHIKAELRRRLTKKNWTRRRFEKAAAAVTTYLERSA